MIYKNAVSFAALLIVAGCATQSQVVHKLAARDLYCEKSQVEVTFLDQPFAGETHYQAVGCGERRNYVCDAVGRAVSTATTGYWFPDFRRCRREMF